MIVAPRRRSLAENGGESTKLWAGWRCGAQKCQPAQVLRAKRHVENAGALPWRSKRMHTAAGTGSVGVLEEGKENIAHWLWQIRHVKGDRVSDMVLFRRGGGHSMEAGDEAYCSLSILAVHGQYCCDTDRLAQSEARPGIVAITHRIRSRRAPSHAPDAARKQQALPVQAGRDKRCQLSLIDARTGEELSPCSRLMAGQ